MRHLSNWSRRRWTVVAAVALLLALVVIPPWRVVAQEKPGGNPAAAPGKPNATTDAGAEDWPTLSERLELEDLAQKDARLRELMVQRSNIQRELNDLVKVHGYGETHPQVLELKKAQESADVEVRARAKKVREILGHRAGDQIIGSIAAATVRIRPAGEGLVEQVAVHEGDRVKKGDLLIQLDARRAQTALARTEAKVTLAEAQFSRLRAAVKEATVSREELDQKEAELKVAQADLNVAKQDLGDTRLLSPIDGIVGELSVRAGERVTRDQTLTTIVETGALKFHANIPSSVLAAYAVGQGVAIYVPTYPKREFNAQISRIAPTVDPATATVRIEASLTGDTAGLLPGMYARAALAPAAPEVGAKQP